MKKNLILVISAFTLFSCVEMKVITKTQYIKNESIKKIGVFEVMIGKPIQAVLPLIDAAAFNAKMNKISDQILDAEKQKINFYRDVLSQNLKNTLGSDIFSGNELQSIKGFEQLRKDLEVKHALETNNDNFPIVLMADGEFNIYPFEKGRVDDYLSGNTEFRNLTSEVCEKLNLDGIAINFTQLNTQGVTSFGVTANSRLVTNVYIFDKKGNTIGHGYAHSKVIKVKGKDISEFQILLDEYSVIIEPLVKQLLEPKSK